MGRSETSPYRTARGYRTGRGVVVRHRLTRWLPTLTTSLGVVHLIWVVADLPDEVTGMLKDGVVGASNTDSRDFATWFFIGGLVLLMIGSTMRWFVRHAGRIPTHLGWWVLALGVFDTLLETDGGGYAMILLGFLILFALPVEVEAMRPVVDAPGPCGQ